MPSDNPNDGASAEDQSAINEVARSVMQKLAAGRSAADIARDLQITGLEKSSADALVEHVQQDWRQIEAAPLANAGLYLRMKYPEMRPVGSPPTLQTVHGVGTGFYGSRDLDRPTGSYVKTQCFCFFFIPVIAMKSYRVTDRGSGWTLIGRVPLSRFAKTWNLLFLCSVLCCIAYSIVDGYLQNPSNRAARKLARADEAAAAGNLVEAGRLYCDVARGRTDHAAEARQRCAKLIERSELDELPLRDVTQIFDDVLEIGAPGATSPAALARGLAIVKAHAQAEPGESIKLLGRIARLSSSDACRAFAELEQGPLGKLAADQTLSIYREAIAMPQEDAQKTEMVVLGIKQCQRLSTSDLPAAFELLTIITPLGDRPGVEKCLTALLGSPLEKAAPSEVAKIVRIAKALPEPADGKKLFEAGMAWVDHHPQTPQREVFGLLDLLAELPSADQSRIASMRRPLLEKLVAANPQDVDLAVQLALALEGEERLDKKKSDSEALATRMVALLTPLRDKLAGGEGARLLGQALASQGKYDDSYALLGPYLETRLDAFHEAEQSFEDAFGQARSRIVNQLQQGTAPGFNYSAFHRMPDGKKQAFAEEYIDAHVKGDPGFDAARDQLARLGMVVPAALDLGMVTLQRAQSMKDAAARRVELERAEKTFLAIRGTAARSDKYMLHLGQVYYWLGKQKEGQAEFEQLLAKHSRNIEILTALAEVLRGLGASAEGRKLLEEAYHKSPDQRVRQGIAIQREIAATSLDDKIHWLELCDANNVNVKAHLAETRGARAEMQGKEDEAATGYREAVALYEQQPQTATVLNDGALASLRLFEVSGDRQALDRGTQWLEKAVSLNPMHPIVLENASEQILRAATQDLAGSKLNLRELQMSGQIDALYFLASDQKVLDELRHRAQEHAGLRKGLSFLDRAIVLAPKNIRNNRTALEIYGFLRDRDALQRLAAQVDSSKPDPTEEIARVLKFYHFQDTEDFNKENMLALIARAEALVTRLRGGTKGPEYAAAVDRFVGLKLSLEDLAAVDVDEMVRLTEDAHRAAPSLTTYQPLIRALMQRASLKLATDFREYATAVTGTQRAVPVTCTLALLLDREDSLGKAARENPDVQRAAALVAARAEAFPETKSPWMWAVLRAARPSRAELRAKCLVPDELDALERQIHQSLMPVSPNAALDTYWQRLAAGAPNAREPLDQLVKLGVPLPMGLIQVQSPKSGGEK